MRRYLCPQCATEVHFSNAVCVSCSARLGYVPAEDRVAAVQEDAEVCGNRDLIGCNWLRDDALSDLCLSCRHTTRIPDISAPVNRERWARLERAKRRLFYAILKFRLPLHRSPGAPRGFLHFEFLGDEQSPDGTAKPVMTGHARGRITINIREADDALREKTRAEMGEPQRTLLGHLRHEVGHYYWDKLVDGQSALAEFRDLFGDERSDYADALSGYYANGPTPHWPTRHVTAYASAHPWEDFAETWAHYLHMVAGLETAYAYGLNPQPLRDSAPRIIQLDDPYQVRDVQDLIDHWIPLTVAMNAMNRAIGNFDYYPFVLNDTTQRKLTFVHDLIARNAEPVAPPVA